MNRPFYAFGMLLALLVLTTLAVSSSTRSTTARRVTARAERGSTLKRPPGGAVFVVVMPAKQRTESQITAARVKLASPVSSPLHDFEDCPSSGDADYDFAVYGVHPAMQPAGTPAATTRQGNLTAEEIVNVFTSLSRASRSPQSVVAKTLGGWTSWSLRPLAVGLKNWIARQADRLPVVWLWKQLLADKVATQRDRAMPRPTMARTPLTWNDYADLIDGTAPLAAAPRATTIQFVSEGRVRSEDGLLLSAASSLHRLALLLELAADRLEQSKSLAKAN